MARGALRRANAAIGAVFVPVFLYAILAQNLGHYPGWKLPLGEESADLLSAIGADQFWTMFGAYFPSHVRIPVVRLITDDGETVILLPAAKPGFSDELEETFELEGLPDDARVAQWRFAFGTGRIEKFESRAANPGPGWLGVRTGYAAAKISRWLADSGIRAEDVRFVDLLSVAIASARDGAPLTVKRIDTLELMPELLPDWPLPHAEPRPDP